MAAKQYLCKVVEKVWLTPTVVCLRFEPSSRFHYDPGQFLSVVVPRQGGAKPLRRAYSFATPLDSGRGSEKPYELCVKVVPNGPGSNYVASLNAGDTFKAWAPYGDFVYEPRLGRSVCFVSTGSGVAPFRAMALSKKFQEALPEHPVQVFGASDETEILYPGAFEPLGVTSVIALSKASAGWSGFKGRVTDYLKALPVDWGWHSTDFYLCGNGQMVGDVKKYLRHARGVPDSSIFQEVYFTARPAQVIDIKKRRKAS